MSGNIGFLTYLVASVSFAILTGLLLLQWRVRPLGPSLTLACATTSLWAGLIGLGTLAEYPPVKLMQAAELARSACWLYFLLQLLSMQASGETNRLRGREWRPLYFVALLLTAAILSLPMLAPALGLDINLGYSVTLSIWLALAIAGLLLIEQLYRNASHGERWSLKYLCLSLGILFTYDFFMYSEALLFRTLDANLWQARGLVNAITAPWLAVAIARNSSWRMNLHLSRQVVFHTVTLMGAGIYLLGMAAVGYFIRFLGGTWGGVLQMAFLVAAGTLLFSLLFSGKLRALVRVQLSKHFFSYHYDYREEWLKFTNALSSLNEDVAQGVTRTMARLVSSPAGLLWGRGDGADFHFIAHWEMPPPDLAAKQLGNLPQWLQSQNWVIDMNEWRQTPDVYDGLELPSWVIAERNLWLIIPLVFGDELEGILIVKKSEFKNSINWEDRDLLKTAGRQAASHLAQHRASQALVEARQFEAFNRLSAYVVHDLKNILAQQSLMVANAAKHRDNPAFIDDMIGTVENSVERMQKLMEQMRSGLRSAKADNVNLATLLQSVISARQNHQPAVQQLFSSSQESEVEADSERLATVFTHLIQNAQEATEADGEVSVQLEQQDSRALVHISDSGCGMDEAFIKDSLFRPFDSTKGLTGMGIGVFESREYIRQIGGDIYVTSEVGQGSVFTVTLPLAGGELAESVTTG